MKKEDIQEEYKFWQETTKNISKIEHRPKTQEEWKQYHYGNGFISAVNKTGILKD